MVIKLVRDEMGESKTPPARVLLVAEQVLIAALLGTLVELAGYEPCFPEPAEATADAVDRLVPAITLVDIRHGAALDDRVHDRVAESGAALCFFGHRSDRLRLEAMTARWGPRVIELPVDYRELERSLGEALAAEGDGTRESGEA